MLVSKLSTIPYTQVPAKQQHDSFYQVNLLSLIKRHPFITRLCHCHNVSCCGSLIPCLTIIHYASAIRLQYRNLIGEIHFTQNPAGNLYIWIFPLLAVGRIWHLKITNTLYPQIFWVKQCPLQIYLNESLTCCKNEVNNYLHHSNPSQYIDDRLLQDTKQTCHDKCKL